MIGGQPLARRAAPAADGAEAAGGAAAEVATRLAVLQVSSES
eukprot:gene2446-1385_t